MTLTLELPKWYDLHTHFRQDELLPTTVKEHVAMACAGALAMPNLKPPLTQPEHIKAYRQEILDTAEGAFQDMIVPLYLNAETTAKTIEDGARDGILQACKYYPPHGTTGSELGAPFQTYIDNGVFEAMEATGVVLCVHGEEHGLSGERYFARGENAEEIFYREHMPSLIERFPALRVVGEHLTTKVGVDFILKAPEHVKASVTPQHLLYTIGHLIQGLKYHLFCMPVVKFEEDRTALQQAVISPDNTKFFAGTDSAPHTKKTTPCGCAAGCFTGGIAPQLYAQGFEAAGVDLSSDTGKQAFQNFLCEIGRAFYDLPEPESNFRLRRSPQTVEPLHIGEEKIIPLPLGIGRGDGESSTTIPWSLL